MRNKLFKDEINDYLKEHFNMQEIIHTIIDSQSNNITYIRCKHRGSKGNTCVINLKPKLNDLKRVRMVCNGEYDDEFLACNVFYDIDMTIIKRHENFHNGVHNEDEDEDEVENEDEDEVEDDEDGDDRDEEPEAIAPAAKKIRAK